MSNQEEARQMHKENQGELSTGIKTVVKNAKDLSLAYSPGVARRKANPEDVHQKTMQLSLIGKGE
ncbi:hypothetical protein [Domibacillus iocasae]|uniref:Uncharacterized protein n=1 Tax=Domibacillus iocasae TaxID=1714016 RepID=A0A1E7DM48_9BACI|nr:hypothetical protein BA724_07595 [Domibacillus iocasae]